MGLRGEMLLVVLLCCMCFFGVSDAGLHVGFYKEKCPKAESIVREVIKEALQEDIGLSADFLRMHFHDCFVRGCDASILLNSTAHNTAERDSPINNPSLEGIDVIDKAKSRVEAACKGVVSCADIIAFAARDGLSMVGGPFYEVPSGRRDGRVSKASEAAGNIPSPKFDLPQLIQNFARKGFTEEEMIILSGAHTIGVAHCTTFDDRLYDFSSKEKQDPSLNPKFAGKLKKICPGPPSGKVDANITANNDLVTPNFFDGAQYYKNVLAHNVLFTSDQSLLSTTKSANLVRFYANNQEVFAEKFVAAIVKLGMTDVKTGSHGEVRLNCAVVN